MEIDYLSRYPEAISSYSVPRAVNKIVNKEGLLCHKCIISERIRLINILTNEINNLKESIGGNQDAVPWRLLQTNEGDV